jgi:hypothetical protein
MGSNETKASVCKSSNYIIDFMNGPSLTRISTISSLSILSKSRGSPPYVKNSVTSIENVLSGKSFLYIVK